MLWVSALVTVACSSTAPIYHCSHFKAVFAWYADMACLTCRGWRIALVDQRNHGRSAEVAGFEPPHTMQAAAQDLMALVQNNFGGQQLDMIVGHSLGGKSTLEFLSQVSQTGSKVSPPQQV